MAKDPNKAKYAIWLPENHEGSRRVNYGGKVFDINKSDDETKKHIDGNYHEIIASPEEINKLRDGYGFAARKLPTTEAVKKEIKEQVEAEASVAPPVETVETTVTKASKGKGK